MLTPCRIAIVNVRRARLRRRRVSPSGGKRYCAGTHDFPMMQISDGLRDCSTQQPGGKVGLLTHLRQTVQIAHRARAWSLGLMLLLCSVAGWANSIGQPNASLVVDSNANQLNFGSLTPSVYQYFNVGSSLFDPGLPTFGNSPNNFLSTGNTMNIPTWNPQLLVGVSQLVPGSTSSQQVSSEQGAAPEPRTAMLLSCGLMVLAWRVRRSMNLEGEALRTTAGIGPPSIAPPVGP